MREKKQDKVHRSLMQYYAAFEDSLHEPHKMSREEFIAAYIRGQKKRQIKEEARALEFELGVNLNTMDEIDPIENYL